MFTKQTFDQNIYMRMFRWAYIFLMVNLCFVLVNLPFFIITTSVAIDPRNIPLFLIGFLLVGPGVIAGISVIDTLKEQKDVDPVKEYFKKYKQFGLRGFIYGLIYWFGLVIGVTDILFFSRFSFGKWILPFFILLVLITLAVSINSWYFQIRNPESKIKDVLRIAFFYTFRKWYVSFLNVILFIFALGVMLLKPQFGFTLSLSLFFGLMYLNSLMLFKLPTDSNKTPQ